MPVAITPRTKFRQGSPFRHGITTHDSVHSLVYPSRPHPSTNTHRNNPVLRLPSRHLAQKRSRQLGSSTAERMAERDGPSVDINFSRVDTEHLQHRQRLRR